MNKQIRVLVVDDSAFMRKTLSNMLDSDSRCCVIGTARNGEEAVQKVTDLKPDVVTLDVEMPGVNGIEALERIMATRPVPVIMVSSLTTEGARDTLRALELGAVDYVPKQLDGVVTNIVSIQQELLAKVTAAVSTAGKLRPVLAPGTAPIVRAQGGLSTHTVSATRGTKLIAIGCSTGGPQALMELLPQFPEDIASGIIVVQHMPKVFTKAFAERMNEISHLEVREAQESDSVKPGVVLIAPGGVHLRVSRRRATTVEIVLSADPEGHQHVPSVDVMMESVASVYGERAVGVILTGMGHDGVEGMRAINNARGRTLAQDEATCVVYGMPKAVADAQVAEKVVPLSQLPGEIMNMI